MAKKLIALFVAAMMALSLIPAAAFAKTAPETGLKLESVQKAENVSARGAKKAEPVKAAVTWDFEEDPTGTWNFIDADGDGYNWTWNTSASYAHESSGSITSASYQSGALTPDNWAQSPYFDMPEGGATLSFWVKNYSSYYPETFEVWYVYEGMGGMNPLAQNLTVSGTDWTQLSYQLPDSEGAQGMIAIRHYGCTDQYKFYIDDVEISDPADPYAIDPVEVDGFPTRIYAGQTPADVLANVTVPEDAHYIIDQLSAYDLEADEELYEDDEFVEGRSYLFGAMVETDLDYYFADGAELLANGGALELDPGYSSVNGTVAFVVPVALVCGGEAPLYGWYFETEDELEGWSYIDADGDGSYWYWLDAESLGEPLAYEGEGYMGSPSWNGGALTPDNYLLTPMLEIPEGTTTLSFYAAGVGASFCAEHFAVYVMTEDAESVDDLVELIPETVATADYVNYTADLSDYAGQTIRVAFRHFNVTDMNWLRLDQVEIFNEAPEVELIDLIEISGYVRPAYGEHPNFNLTVPEGVGYYIDHVVWNWYEGGTNHLLNSDSVFDQTDGFYYAEIWINWHDGYTMAEHPTVLINGEQGHTSTEHLYEWPQFLVQTEHVTVEEPEPQPELIDTVAIEGFTVPAWDENPDFDVTVPEDAHYSIDYTAWLCDGDQMIRQDVFDSETSSYMMSIVLVPEEGYEFADEVEATINGGTEYIGVANNTGEGTFHILTIEFTVEEPEPQPELIDTIEILDFVVPAWGENPYYNVTVPTDVHYTIDYTDWNWWSDELYDGDILLPSETFDNESYVYYQYFEIIPDEGYAFADQVTVLINGDATIAENHGWSENSGYYWIYTIDFAVEEPGSELIPIHEVYVNGYEAPVAGEDSQNHLNFTVPADAHYTIVTEGLNAPSWWDNDEDVPFYDIFFEGTNYSAGVTLNADEGYYFADDVVIYVNDDADLVDWTYSGLDMDDNTICYVWTVPEPATAGEEPGEPVLGYFFESDYEVADYTFLDGDGDNYTWSRVSSTSYAYEGEGCMGSRYNSSSEVNNWMILPEFHVPETDPSMTFYARERTTTYGTEYLGIYVGTDPEDLDSFVQIGSMLVIDHVDYRQYEFDLAAYAGQNVYIAFRHYNCTDTFYLYIDQLEFWGVYDEQPPVEQIITEVDVIFDIPEYGAAPDFTPEVPEGAHYSISDFTWNRYDGENDIIMTEEDVFDDPNSVYYLVFELTPDEGWDFAEDCIATVNGQAELFDFGFPFEGYFYGMSVEFTVEAPAVDTYGDVDLDGNVEAEDALLAMRCAMGLIELTDEQLAQMDVNGDGVYDLVDAVLILRYAMGLIDQFPIELE